MKKKEIKKIEDKLSDIEVPDSVISLARAEMPKTYKEQKPASMKFSFKIALSCVASFVLCLAIILPVTLSSLDEKPNDAEPDSSMDSNAPSHEIPSQDGSASAMPPSFTLEELEQEKVYTADKDIEKDPSLNDPSFTGPPTGASIVKLSRIEYSYSGAIIMSEEEYSVYGAECTVYTLYDTSIEVDVLERFESFTKAYSVGSVKINYKISGGTYLADANYNNKRYCFDCKFTQTVFEEFCQFLFQNN